MLKLVLQSLEGLPDEVAALYKKAGDGNYHLQTEEDTDAKRKIQEFRDNNIALTKELEAIKKKFEGIDLEEIITLKKKVQDVEDKKLIEAGKIDELVDQKVERMKQDFETQLNAMKKALDEKDGAYQKVNSRLAEVLIDSEITKAVNAVGVVKREAMRDILSRGRDTWKLDEDGKPVPKEGDRLLYGKDGKAALTFEEWAKGLFTDAPFLFEDSAGGGANGGNRQGGGFAGGKQDLSKMPATERLKYIHENPSAAGGGTNR